MHSLSIPTAVSCEIKRLTHSWVLWISGPFCTLQNSFPLKIRSILSQTKLHFFKNNVSKRFSKLKLAIPPALISDLIPILLVVQRMLISSAIGFRRYLRIRGVGYKFTIESTGLLVINVGYSHTLTYMLKKDFQIKATRKFKMIRVRSTSLNAVTGMACFLRNLSKPDVYRGKGIRYRWTDPVRRKEGKKRRTF